MLLFRFYNLCLLDKPNYLDKYFTCHLYCRVHANAYLAAINKTASYTINLTRGTAYYTVLPALLAQEVGVFVLSICGVFYHIIY
jgi:hypothetical protein